MNPLTVKDIKEIIKGLDDDYMLYMYNTCVTDPIEEMEIDSAFKRVIFK